MAHEKQPGDKPHHPSGNDTAGGRESIPPIGRNGQGNPVGQSDPGWTANAASIRGGHPASGETGDDAPTRASDGDENAGEDGPDDAPEKNTRSGKRPQRAGQSGVGAQADHESVFEQPTGDGNYVNTGDHNTSITGTDDAQKP